MGRGPVVLVAGVGLIASALASGGCEGSGKAGRLEQKPGSIGRREPLPGAIVGKPDEGAMTPEVVAAAPSGLPATDALAGKVGAKGAVAGRTGAESSVPPAKEAGVRVAQAATPAQTPTRVQAPTSTAIQAQPAAALVSEVGSRVDMVVVVKPSAAAVKQGAIAARVGEKDGSAPIWFVYPEIAADGGGTSARVRDWIGTSVLWRTSKSAPKVNEKDVGGLSAGFWVAVVPVADGADVVVDGKKFEVGARETAGNGPRVRRVAASAFAREMLSGLRRSPMVRWRARLAAGEPLIGAEGAADVFADATLEGLARTTERAWAGVLGKLNEANGELASRFASRLAGVVDIGEGVEIPVWPADANSGAAMESLLADLLRAGEDRERAAKIAEAWLAAQPVGGAVVVDDAAAIDLRSGLTFPSVLLTNLSDQPASAMASRAETATPEMLRLEPFAAVFASVGAAAKVEEGIDPRRRTGLEAMRDGVAERTIAEVRVGEWRGKRAVVGEIAKIGPPGMYIGPLLSDWTQQTFLAAALDETSQAEMRISGSVSGFGGRLKPADDQGGAAGPGRWMILFEAARSGTGGANGAAKDDRSELVLSFGARGATGSQTLRVLADGSLYEVRNGQAMAAGNATMKRSGDRTFYWVPVPSAAIEAGKVLRLGLVRIDERGRRSAWPRPMLPWQTEPGRVAVDLSSWSPVKE